MKASYQISVVNSTTQATPTNFQQLIQTTLQYPSGVRFWSPTDGWLYGWLESLSSTNQAVIWVKIPSSIPAGGVYQIYMVEDSSLNFDGVYWGEAPTLSSSYAQYDNGANVFNNYWNFAGTNLPSGWSANSGGSYSVNNGLTQSSSSSTNVVISPTITPLSGGEIFEEYVNLPSSVNYDPVAGYGTTSSSSDAQNGYSFLEYSSPGIWQVSGGSWTHLASSSFTYGNILMGLIWSGSSLIGQVNYATQVSTTNTTFSLSQVTQIVLRNASGMGTSITYYVRTRAYPPNGVMPETAIVPLQAWEVFMPPLP